MRICLLSQSPVADDPRVRRQGELFHNAGFDVRAVGLPGARSQAPAWRIDEVPGPLRPRGRARLAWGLRVVAGGRIGYPEPAYWRVRLHRDMLEGAMLEPADVYLANDWRVLPIAARAARAHGAVYAYDSHEFAPDEHAGSRMWEVLYSPYVRAVERRYIGGASLVSTVCDGFADMLRSRYSLPARPLVIRNTPEYEPMPFRDPRWPVTVLYHGILASDRCLDVLIDSVALWPEGFRLMLRGPGKPAVVAALHRRAEVSPARERIEFTPSVPLTELVGAANHADVGVITTHGRTVHSEYSLPNKLFEYTMAGLAVCASNTREVAGMIKRWGLGTTIAAPTAEAMAAAISSLTLEDIAACKQRALTAARELCWDNEGRQLLDAVSRLPRRPV